MSNIFNGFKDSVSNLFQGTPPQSQEGQSREETGKDSGRERPPRSSTKRAHTPESAQAERSGKKAKLGSQPLIKSRDTIPSQPAFRIATPRYEDPIIEQYTENRRVAARNTIKDHMAKLPGSRVGYRPMNTLDAQPHQSRASDTRSVRNLSQDGLKPRDKSMGTAEGRLQAKRRMASYTKPDALVHGDDSFDDGNRDRAIKRKRMEYNSSTRVGGQITISDDEESHQPHPRGFTVPANGRGKAKTFKDSSNSFELQAKQQLQRASKKDIFSIPVVRSMDKWMTSMPKSHKGGEKASQTQSSQGYSQSPSPALHPTHNASPENGKKSRPSFSDSLKTVDPPEVLPKRVSKVSPPAKSCAKQQTFGEAVSYLVDTTEQTKSRHQNDKEPRLSSSFKREHEKETRPARQKASQRMRANSVKETRMSSVDESEDDELQGGNTDLHRGIQIVPRAFNDALAQKRPTKSPKRLISPSDLRPSNLNFLKQGAATGGIEDDDAKRIPVREIHCRSYMETKTGLELVWDGEDKLLYVEMHGERVKALGKERMISIGALEANDWYEATGSNIVQVKGSVTENSMKQIFIVFESEQGRSDCLKYLLYANPTLEQHKFPKEKIDSTFRRQVPIVQQDFQRYAQNQTSHRDLELSAMQRRHGILTTTSANSPLAADDDNSSRRSWITSQNLGREIDSFKSQSASHDAQYTVRPASLQIGTRRSTRQTQPVKTKTPTPEPLVRWTESNTLPRWKEPVTYPTNGTKRVTVEFDDLERLDEGQFLNDNIISFGLRQIEEAMAPEFRQQVHFFSTFFYSALTKGKTRGAINYEGVKRWTKKTDIFNTSYVIVPINIDLHWFVFIICNLPNIPRELDEAPEESHSDQGRAQEQTNLTSLAISKDASPSGSQGETEKHSHDLAKGAWKSKEQHTLYTSEPVSGRSSPFQTTIAFDDSGKVASDTKQDDVSSSKRGVKRNGKNIRSVSPDKPVILTLDSFGVPHTVEVRHIKQYLAAEAQEKRGMFIDPVGTHYIQGVTAKGIPEQTNFCDCGVFLIEYINQFAKNPEEFVRMALTREMDSQATFGAFDPNTKRAELRDALLELNRKREHPEEAESFEGDKLKPGVSSRAAAKCDLTSSIATPIIDLAETKSNSPHTGSKPAQASRQCPQTSHDLVDDIRANEKPSGETVQDGNHYTADDGQESSNSMEAEVPRAFNPKDDLSTSLSSRSSVEVDPRSDAQDSMLLRADETEPRSSESGSATPSSKYATSTDEAYELNLNHAVIPKGDSLMTLLKEDLRRQSTENLELEGMPNLPDNAHIADARQPRTLIDSTESSERIPRQSILEQKPMQGVVPGVSQRREHLKFDD